MKLNAQTCSSVELKVETLIQTCRNKLEHKQKLTTKLILWSDFIAISKMFLFFSVEILLGRKTPRSNLVKMFFFLGRTRPSCSSSVEHSRSVDSLGRVGRNIPLFSRFNRKVNRKLRPGMTRTNFLKIISVWTWRITFQKLLCGNIYFFEFDINGDRLLVFKYPWFL